MIHVIHFLNNKNFTDGYVRTHLYFRQLGMRECQSIKQNYERHFTCRYQTVSKLIKVKNKKTRPLGVNLSKKSSWGD
ncbi:hypothetical protein BW156_05810 [Lactococcus cremoris]|nr:hypothetical protein [Lactococcus cremoris]MCT4416810.1 hypothetical protein [Lactococcus cremoris]PFH00566.1 hypothetical protein BW156_05810 [Lactococcus cremoris]